MRFSAFQSDPPKTPYAPVWEYFFGFSSTEDIDLEKLSQLCLDKEDEILELDPRYNETGDVQDGMTGLGENSTTSRWYGYNVLLWNTPETEYLKKYIKDQVIEYNEYLHQELPDKLYIQCWVNILRSNQSINLHMHNYLSDAYLSANYTVKGEGTMTCYMNPIDQFQNPEIITHSNKPGQFALFPSNIPHYVTEYNGTDERITLGIDISAHERCDGVIVELDL